MNSTTSTARVIAELEQAAPDPELMTEILAGAVTDTVFREVLDATYDPFKVWDLPRVPLVPIQDPDKADLALATEWEVVREILDLSAVVPCERSRLFALYSSSAAWPIYQRIVSKRFVEVPLCVSNQWGTLPVFKCAPVMPAEALTERSWSGRVVAVPRGARRCLVMVREPHSDPVVDFFDVCGQDSLRSMMAPEVEVAIQQLDYSVLESDGPYADGIVFDCWILSTLLGGPFDMVRAWDIVPLSVFKRQGHSPPFIAREAVVRSLANFEVGGLFNMALAQRAETTEERARLLEEHGALFSIDPESQYPFSRPSSWRWIKEGDVTFD